MAVLFFADHCVPTSVVDDLRRAGHEVLLLREHLPTESPDDVVLDKAGHLVAVLVSLDGDFADIVRFPPRDYGGIIGLQVKNRPSVIPHIMASLLEFLEGRVASDLKGKLIIVEPDRIRIR